MNKAMAPIMIPMRAPLDRVLAAEYEDDVAEVEEDVEVDDVDDRSGDDEKGVAEVYGGIPAGAEY
jgi:flavin-dependent dehydrogenase